jgi:hypothetical protein
MSLSSITSAIASSASAASSFGPQPPASQKAGDRPISFVLTDMTQASITPVKVTLIIRPEELTRTDVSRATVQQTLGGAWADDFGPGITSVSISGTTGWRGNATADGMGQFAILKQQVFTGWHQKRLSAVKAGNDPRGVELRFVDALDSTVDLVQPMNFVLRRSKSRPLLMQFNISMLVLSSGAYTAPPSTPTTPLASMLLSIQRLIAGAKNAVNFVNGIVGQITSFMQTATSIFQSTSNLITAAEAVPQSLLGSAQAMAQAGATMFATIAAIPANTTAQMAAAMSMASEFSNILCLLGNAVNTQQTYPDYTPLYGASNCSSTSGGSPVSPYAESNPFYAVVGAPQNAAAPAASVSTAPVIAVPAVPIPTVTVTPAAQQSLALINNSDPVLAPMPVAALGTAAATIAKGVTVS